MGMKTVRYVQEWIKWILIRIENWCVRARMDEMDFDSNGKLVYEMVPIGSY